MDDWTSPNSDALTDLTRFADEIQNITMRKHEIGCTAHRHYGACVDGCETDAQLRKRRKGAL